MRTYVPLSNAHCRSEEHSVCCSMGLRAKAQPKQSPQVGGHFAGLGHCATALRHCPLTCQDADHEVLVPYCTCLRLCSFNYSRGFQTREDQIVSKSLLLPSRFVPSTTIGGVKDFVNVKSLALRKGWTTRHLLLDGPTSSSEGTCRS